MLCPADPLVVRQVLHPAQVQVPHLVPLPVVLRAEAHLRLRVGRPVQHLVLLRVEARVEVHHHHQVILPVILPHLRLANLLVIPRLGSCVVPPAVVILGVVHHTNVQQAVNQATVPAFLLPILKAVTRYVK